MPEAEQTQELLRRQLVPEDREKVLAVTREWVDKAENDLKNAAHTLTMGEKCPTDTVCFHATHHVYVHSHIPEEAASSR